MLCRNNTIICLIHSVLFKNNTFKMEYENQRLKRIEENKRKMEELGIKLNYKASTDQKKRKMNKIQSTKVVARDFEYIPDEGCDVDLSSEEDNIEILPNIKSLRSQSKKVTASRGENPLKSFKPKCSTISMSNVVNMQAQARKNHENQRKSNDIQKKVLTPVNQQQHSKQSGRLFSQDESQQSLSLPISQQGKDVHKKTLPNKGKGKTVVAPGSLNAYIRMKERSKERISSPDDSIHLKADLSSGLQLFDDHSGDIHGVFDEDDDIESSDDDKYEVEKAADPEDSENDMAELRNDLISSEGHLTNQLVLQKQKRKRGATMCLDVHLRSIDERKPIILNELGQPIGPCSGTVDEFSRFLGSLARTSSFAPLHKRN